MALQLRILLGITIWLGGVILDALLFPYVFALIYIGIALTFFEVIKWLLERENRKRAKEVFGFGKPRDFLTMIRTAFDFSWRRISVLDNVCRIWHGTHAARRLDEAK
jgi:small-conductance mechanosensitive channel